MEQIHQAIILHPLSAQRSRYLVFDNHWGPIELSLKKRGVFKEPARGALIEYTPQQQSNRYSATHLEIIAMPDLWAVEHIHFLHHLVELIDFFIPAGNQAEYIFSLMLLIYRPLPAEVDMLFFQKFFLCKFFILVGIYPEPRHLQDHEFLTFMQAEQALVIHEKKYVFLEKKMIQWLQECIRLHPHADRLKTTTMEPWYG